MAGRVRAWRTPERVLLLSIGVTALSGAARLGRQPLSWNETVTLSAAGRSWPHLLGLLMHTDAPLGAYYTLTHGWISLLRTVDVPVLEASLRLPSLMATAVVVVLLFRLVSGLYDAPTAAVAAAVYSCYPLVTFYATDARPYALVTVIVLISVLVLRRTMCSGSMWRYAGYAACVCLAIYLQFFALYAVLAQGVLAHAYGQTRRWALAVSAAVAASAPLLWVAHRQTAEIGWIPQPSVRSITSFVGLLGGGPGLIAVAVVAAGAVLIRVRPVRLSVTSRFLLVWAVTGPVLLVVGDFVRPDAVARYALVCVAPAVALLARAIRRLPARLGAALLAAALLSTLGGTVIGALHPYKYENYRSAVDAIGDHSDPGDAVLFLPISTRVGFDTYAADEQDVANVRDLAVAARGLPMQTTQLGGVDAAPTAVGAALGRAAGIFVVSVSAQLPSGRHLSALDTVQLQAIAHRHLVWRERFGGIYISLYEDDGSGAH